MGINKLFEKVLQGDRAAEKELFESLSVRFRAIVHQRIWDKNDSEDVAQEALMTIVTKYREVVIEKNFSAWAAKVLDNRILAYIKRKRASQSRISNSPPEEYQMPVPPELSDLKHRLLKCLKEIFRANPRYARILNLHYQGYTTEEVCRLLKITSSYSYVILSRARNMLVKCLDEEKEAGDEDE